MKFTGERVIPDETPKNIFLEHVSRYSFASKFVKKKLVLDIACGTGYGTEYLLKKGYARKVYGGDISPESINYAKKRYKNKNLVFRVMRAEKMPFKDNFFDVIVSFETIEHLEKYREFLFECRRVLKRGGRIIISTPNKKVSSPFTKNPCNPFHIKEFYLQEFKDLLNNFFVVEGVYGQKLVKYTFWFKLRQLFGFTIIKIKKIYPKIIETIKLFVKMKKVEKNKLDKIIKIDNMNKKIEPTYMILVAKKIR